MDSARQAERYNVAVLKMRAGFEAAEGAQLAREREIDLAELHASGAELVMACAKAKSETARLVEAADRANTARLVEAIANANAKRLQRG